EQLAQGETAEDLVSQAVAKVFSGERKWDWGRHPNLEEFLKGVIDSLMNSLVNAIDNRVVKKLPAEPEKLEALLDKMSLSSANQHRMAPEAALLQAEREGEILKSISELIGDDPDLVKLWNCIRQGISKPKQIAEATGLPIEDVYNLGEKLRRRLKE